jgi:excisionase family DNA binding protein
MEKLLSFSDAEILTGMKVPTWRAWTAARRTPVVRLGRQIKLRESDLQKLIESNVVPARPAGDAR